MDLVNGGMVQKVLKWVLIIFAVIPLVLIGLWWLLVNQENNWYRTSNTVDYGRITGNGNNEYVEELVDTFFPEQIEPYFENVVYEYQVRKWCDYCCEVYLEFTIDDQEQFQSYVQKVTEGLTGTEFAYDSQYTDYVVSSALPVVVWSRTENNGKIGEHLEVEFGRMGRILVCEEEQRIIFTSVMVSGCCGEDPESFDFYERFGIDPFEYAQTYCEVRYSNLD